MDLEEEVIKFIESYGRIRYEIFFPSFLSNIGYQYETELKEPLDTKKIDQTIKNLIDNKEIIQDDGYLTINKNSNNNKANMKGNENKLPVLDLFWFGQIIEEIDYSEFRLFISKLIEEFDKKDWIRLDPPEISQTSINAKFSLRIFSIESTLFINDFNFTISSSSTLNNIPLLKNRDIVSYPLLELPKSYERLILTLSPNLSVNYIIYSIISYILESMPTKKTITLIKTETLISR